MNRKNTVILVLLFLLIFSIVDARVSLLPAVNWTFIDVEFEGFTFGNLEYREELSGRETIPGENLIGLIVQNRFGEVNISSEDRDDIAVDFEVIIESNTEARLKEAQEEIELEMIEDNGQLSIRMLRPEDETNLEVQTNLKVRAPRDLTLELSNDFGLIQLTDWQQEVKIDSSYSSVRLNDLEGFLHLRADFSDLEINNLSSDLEIRTRHGNASINNLTGNIRLDSRFTNYEIENSLVSLQGDISYGGLQASEITGSVDLDSDFAGITLTLPADIEGWGFDIETRNGSISTGRELAIQDEGRSERLEISGDAGKPLLRIHTSHSGVTLN